MGCIVIGTGIFGCSEGGSGDPLHLRAHNFLGLEDEATREGSEWTRSSFDDVSLVQSEYFVESVTTPMALSDFTTTVRHQFTELTGPLSFVESITVSGGRFELPSGENIQIPAIFDSATLAGMPVYVSGDGRVDLSDASSPATTNGTVGLAIQDAMASGTGFYIADGQLNLPDWTDATGSASLIPGATYYLSTTPGLLTVTPPSQVGELVLRVGTATTTSVLDIEISQSILL